ncbi:XrtA/PEP-CTERM system histidine kinase PrsK [Sphingomonas colocasiae]|uniref:histidine kinase n=1 Tax=Sphingomonas colocasiae TaxID=1848973 RepID=A0ABS7PTL9_9SPHN|nr:XrtA/PEP-CTERM system histidine kinase PrsK [Sphingomonas colocasiae]MBY8824680.1 PEP-CTERM system histidine kinase PrsK [Sphingomonas colocasiae]
MIATIGIWSHAVAAGLFALLAAWQARRGIAGAQIMALIGALALSAVWAFAAAAAGSWSVLGQGAETLRNMGWLGFMYLLLRQGRRGDEKFGVTLIYIAVALLGVGLMMVNLAPLVLPVTEPTVEALFYLSLVLRMMSAVAALVLVHNLYTAAAPEARWGIRLVMFGLAGIWLIDLNIYTLAYLGGGWSSEAFMLRGCAMVVAAPVFGFALRRNERWQLRLSRTVTFQSLSLIALCAYLVAVVLVAGVIESVSGALARTVQAGFVMTATVAALALLPSPRFRAWFRVKLAKHFFRHRYDYRAEWIRFTDTLGRPGEGAVPLDVRVIKAVADITESPGGLLLVPGEADGLGVQAQWNWSSLDVQGAGGDAGLAAHLASGRIVEFDALRHDDPRHDREAALLPQWMLGTPDAWALVPLVHFDRLQGAVLLERPPVDRALDWEDFDLLRIVGRQIASYLAEARGQEALSDARRFDEFNRRFAFIMHDIKNLVSQLSLVARNAERHADNPEFRADMVATLQSSVGKMNDLLARLSQHNKGRHEEPRRVSGQRIVEAVAAARNRQHPVVVMAVGDPMLIADPARLEQALGHLVQNAIEASPAGEPVLLSLVDKGAEIAIEVRDRGAGMSQEFVRSSLFKPFASTKEGGFGVGAFEARTLIAAMGGRIDVESREGEGTKFIVTLPAASRIPEMQ